MNLRLADMSDLPKIKAVYRKIIENMDRDNVQIWDEIYPCECFVTDIKRNRLYVLTEHEDVAGAFALCDANDGEAYVRWENKDAKAFYIDRLGVNTDYLRRGLGSYILKRAMELAGEQGAGYLRLFVVDINKPAINLYLKNGFIRAGGIFEERIDEELVLREYGYEIKIPEPEFFAALRR